MDSRTVRLKRKNAEAEHLTKEQQMVRFAIAAVALLILFVVGLKYFADRSRRQLSSSSDLQSRGLHMKLSMSKSSYREGEDIVVNLLVHNISEKDVTLNFPDDLEFDFTVQSELDLLFTQIPQNIYQYSSEAEHFPHKKPHSIVLAPGKQQTFRGVWKQQNFSGQRVKPGRYIITGYLKSSNYAEQLQLRGQTSK